MYGRLATSITSSSWMCRLERFYVRDGDLTEIPRCLFEHLDVARAPGFRPRRRFQVDMWIGSRRDETRLRNRSVGRQKSYSWDTSCDVPEEGCLCCLSWKWRPSLFLGEHVFWLGYGIMWQWTFILYADIPRQEEKGLLLTTWRSKSWMRFDLQRGTKEGSAAIGIAGCR